MVSSLLSEADARAIEATVARVESSSSAELVVAVLPRSHDYWQGRVALAAAWALAAGLALLHFVPRFAPLLLVPVEALVGLAAFAAAGYRPLFRLLISDNAAQEAVKARAFQLFAERGLHRTRGRTGVLIFVSELEHRVVLLGDQTVDAALGQAGWDRYVELLVERIRSGQARAGILELLDQIEPHLAWVAPPTLGDVNELPDAPLRY